MALRPEFTPSLARMVLQKGKGLPLPVKWFTLAQCWRFERSTRGRRREHYQWNMDCIGELCCILHVDANRIHWSHMESNGLQHGWAVWDLLASCAFWPAASGCGPPTLLPLPTSWVLIHLV